MSDNQPILDEKGELVSTSKENVKEFGEVMTPPHIVKAMVDQLPEEVWNDPTYVFMEPCCGTGNFLVEVLERKLNAGISIEEALNTIIGMDVNKTTLAMARNRLLFYVPVEEPLLYHRCQQIIWNNIFWVEDSISFITNGGFETKKFVYDDPTGHNCVMTTEERDTIPNQ